ncbi:hypothetical protein Q9Q51_01215 [Campylobacter upsaliensis]|uniref:hypothetical protein n=1 Tax=Campylobacter upsaliensis TaxID=28080 RepID=UPI002B3E9EF1|nr:hypothetical protein [Campylobacter upsaliensis]MEB2823926.1 hypothetical protein [Campylobacter upsaliensis]MEB2825825.1 hypothetical protein [Campylobacter upsaliensis]
MKNLIVDLDGTLTLDEKNIPYEDKKPNLALIKQLQKYQKWALKSPFSPVVLCEALIMILKRLKRTLILKFYNG